MAELETDNMVISTTNEGFPDWLNFTKLRQEGIDYLGELSGKIWTDHNVHDPGITILEMLCYALLDLGYRTSLPEKDLFSRNPKETGKDNNFFTPAQILGCNPLTIADYRRLIIDLDGVRNAWLLAAEDVSIEKICNQQFARSFQRGCERFLNGLYHVYIDLEASFDVSKQPELKKKIVKLLMAHRNLCEDFYDIIFLCKQGIGVCADIELDSGANPAIVLPGIIQALSEFFAPSPTFYRLKDLLDKGRSIEEVFAGRPIDLTESNGFVDIEEFEQITLRREVYVSDVYSSLFAVKGVSAIRNLTLRNCDGSVCADPGNRWIFKLFEDHVPELDLSCSGFRFTRNGIELPADLRPFLKQSQISFSNNGKTISKVPSANLDLLLEQGNYMEDLASYLPLENDFPKVYGITEGSLSDKVSDLRKSQSLQLRGYLLFFDHLLSGYLSQLQHVRDLFALAPGDAGNEHTYFVNQQEGRSGLDKLLRFPTEDSGIQPFEGNLAFPVDKQQIDEIVQSGWITDCDVEKTLEPFPFCSTAERDNAILQWMEDLSSGNYTEHFINTAQGCWLFYLEGSSKNVVMVGQGSYQTETAAQAAMMSILFLASEKTNFKSYNGSVPGKSSFEIATGITGYWNYLQKMVEGRQLYGERRTVFLNHLLARFAETFTDFAMLSYASMDKPEWIQKEIKYKQAFLGAYPELSSTRGKAFDYSVNGWNNANVSGLEKRLGAYAGMHPAKEHRLCHFEVGEFEEQLLIRLAYGNQALFNSDIPYDDRELAAEKLAELLMKAKEPKNYTVEPYPGNKSILKLDTGVDSFTHPQVFNSDKEATDAIDRLSQLFDPSMKEEEIIPSLYAHSILLNKKTGGFSWSKKDPVRNTEKDFVVQPDIVADFNKRQIWLSDSDEFDRSLVSLKFVPSTTNSLVNVKAFGFAYNGVDVKNQSLIYKFTVSDQERKRFFFISEEEFDNTDVAEAAAIQFLFEFSDTGRCDVIEGVKGQFFHRALSSDGKVRAINTIESNSLPEAQDMIPVISGYINDQIYSIQVQTKAVQWKYTVRLAFPGGREFIFHSKDAFDDQAGAREQAERIVNPDFHHTIQLNKNETLEIRDMDHPRTATAIYSIRHDGEAAEEQRDEARDLLAMKRQLLSTAIRPTAAERANIIIPDPAAGEGPYRYRLVKKDGYHAWYPLTGDFTDEAMRSKTIIDLFAKFRTGASFVDICYGGHNIFERKDDRNRSWFHYRIMPRGEGAGPTNVSVFFESSRGYSSADEAQQAFMKEYLQVLSLALDQANYGETISFDEVLVQGEDIDPVKAIVFIPDLTMKLFGYNKTVAASELSIQAARYPVKSLKKSDALFQQYFCCGVKPDPTVPTACDPTPEIPVYYFSLSATGMESWISSTWFERPEDALKAFYFFLLLLEYKGNYKMAKDDCDCSWRLYIREILAISKKGFITPAAAWGPGGVEHFICASQTEGGFQSYRSKEYCFYSFHVGCGNTGLIHPCSYDTVMERDQAIDRLIGGAQELFDQLQNGQLKDEWEKLAKTPDAIPEKMLTVLEPASPCSGYPANVKSLLRADNSKKPLSAIEKASLSPSAFSFPVARRKMASVAGDRNAAYDQLIAGSPVDDGYRYYLEINLPGFCADPQKELKPCGCGEEGVKPCSCCCGAWVSDCCFDTAEEALRYFYTIAACMTRPEHYYRVFDCECGPFGIRFYCDCPTQHRRVPTDPTLYDYRQQDEREKPEPCCHEIIAYNPQQYPFAKMACESVERAKCLINAEGMHLVEHLLLRPHCIDGDCQFVIPVCDTDENCNFEWPLPDDDPCTSNRKYCFTPGSDPYSFIATAILPAWPERFRKKESRQMIEQMLYRELPAHIMLRILWLTPKDLCHFESIYKEWKRWLARKPLCTEDLPPQKLIDFLFRRDLECFNCDECTPCVDTETPDDPCRFNLHTKADPNAYVNTINDLYCWPRFCPAPLIRQNNLLLERVLARKIEPEEKIGLKPAEIPPDHDAPSELLEFPPAVMAAPIDALAEPAAEDEELLAPDDIADAERNFDARWSGYRETAKDIMNHTAANSYAEAAHLFLLNGAPSFNDFRERAEQVMQNKKAPENAKALNTEQKRTLIQLVTWHYLDRAVLAGKLIEHTTDMKELFRKLHHRELMPEYKNWKGRELLALNPEAPVKEVQKIMKSVK